MGNRNSGNHTRRDQRQNRRGGRPKAPPRIVRGNIIWNIKHLNREQQTELLNELLKFQARAT